MNTNVNSDENPHVWLLLTQSVIHDLTNKKNGGF